MTVGSHLVGQKVRENSKTLSVTAGDVSEGVLVLCKAVAESESCCVVFGVCVLFGDTSWGLVE